MLSVNQVDFGHIIAFTTGVPVSNLNPAMVNLVNDRFQASLEDCSLFYANCQMPWTLMVPEYFRHQSVDNLLQSNDFHLNDEGVAMSLVLEEMRPCISNAELQIKTMENDLRTWSIPLLHGFESVPEITRIYAHQHQVASQSFPNLHHFSGFIGDTVVCSLTLSTWKNQARLDDIATMPTYQKQGYATTLIDAVLKKIVQLNISHCHLEASSSGLNVYKKIGFKPLFKNYYYEKG